MLIIQYQGIEIAVVVAIGVLLPSGHMGLGLVQVPPQALLVVADKPRDLCPQQSTEDYCEAIKDTVGRPDRGVDEFLFDSQGHAPCVDCTV